MSMLLTPKKFRKSKFEMHMSVCAFLSRRDNKLQLLCGSNSFRSPLGKEKKIWDE